MLFSFTVLGTQLEGVAGALQVGACDDELGAADLAGSDKDAGEVVWVFLDAMISASEDGVR